MTIQDLKERLDLASGNDDRKEVKVTFDIHYSKEELLEITDEDDGSLNIDEIEENFNVKYINNNRPHIQIQLV